VLILCPKQLLVMFGNNTPLHWTNGNNVTHNGQEIVSLWLGENRTSVSTSTNSCTTSVTSSANLFDLSFHHSWLQLSSEHGNKTKDGGNERFKG
jgi:hypothetical protein